MITNSKIKFDINNDEWKEMSDGPRTMIHQGFLSDGSFPNNKTIEYNLKLLFPIIDKKLSKNKIVSIKTELPMILYGSNITLTGNIKIKCTNFVKIDDRVCARIISEIKLDDTNVPIKLKKQIELNIIGYGIYYYDIKKNTFIFGNIIINTDVKTETDTSTMNSNLDEEIGNTMKLESINEDKMMYSIVK